MNLQSWIILIAILAICSYIVYNSYIKDGGEGAACKNCSQAKKFKRK
ncbi:MAG: FeoB-associated Cys-rich membrane protein [Anaerococcus sp.]|nr:FeoB-associated Cys-rich membrane protein [Anaerococcus sp.]